ncbi:MAG: DUF4395 domain-containing protein, partial [Bacteroidota bacterium]
TLIIVLFLLTSNIYLMIFLAADFLLRAIDRPKLSPLAITAKGMAETFSFRREMINAGPKLFAARIGLLFSVAIVVLTLTGSVTASFVLAGVLGLFSFLESAFGLCVACKVYPFVYRWVYISSN